MSHGQDWDRRYASTDRLFSTDPDEALVELAGGLTPGRALDLGAGEGRNSLWLARRGWQVTAVDLSTVAMDRLAAEAAANDLAIKTELADLSDYLARGEQFDLVIVANIHPAPEERSRLLAAAAGAVASGGHLFVVGHHLDSLGGLDRLSRSARTPKTALRRRFLDWRCFASSAESVRAETSRRRSSTWWHGPLAQRDKWPKSERTFQRERSSTQLCPCPQGTSARGRRHADLIAVKKR